MNYSFYASLLNASSNPESFPEYLRALPTGYSIIKTTKHYTFIQSSTHLILLAPGNVKCNNNQLLIQPSSNQSFKLLNDFTQVKQSHPSKKQIGVGYSNGANLILALADIEKTLEVVCFNPIGLGKKLHNSEFYEKFRLDQQSPKLNIYKTDSNELCKQFTWPNYSINSIPGKQGISPHSLANFEAEAEVKIEGLNKTFPKISAITFNPKTGFLLIETENSIENFYLEGDLAAIFYSVYTDPEQISFTLVPADKNNPSGPYQRKVYWPEFIENTSLGNYLWEADWKLKQMDMGLWYDDLTGQTIPISSEIPWFKSGFDFYSEEDQQRSMVRLWFVMEKTNFEYSTSEKGVCVKPGNVSIKVQARKLETDSDTKFGLKDTQDYHTAYKFAEYFNSHMDELSELVPEIKKLKEISVLIAIAKFFRDDLRIPSDMINLPLLKSRIQVVEDFYEKNKVPRISRKAEFVRGEDLVVLNLVGGVSMISQSSNRVLRPDLIKYVNRSDEILTPFYLSHYDYVKELIEYQESTEDEDSSFVTAFEFCTVNECSEPSCNNFVTFDCKKNSLDSSAEIFEEITPYSFEGKLYCKEHHPFRCRREECGETIFPGDNYAELEYGKFHSSCIICEFCEKGIVSSFLYEKGFWHVECFKNKDEVEARKKNKILQEERKREEDLKEANEEREKKAKADEERKINEQHKKANENNKKKAEESKKKVEETKKKVEETKKKVEETKRKDNRTAEPVKKTPTTKGSTKKDEKATKKP